MSTSTKPGDRGPHATQLYLNGVNRSFDGYKAINDLSIYMEKGELRAVVGPNGAGKTTMLDIITGKTRPDSGEVVWDNSVDLTRLDEAGSARLGIGRKFQKPTVFETLTVYDNFLLSLAGDRGVPAALFYEKGKSDAEQIDALMETVRMTEHRFRLAGSLSHGQKQWLEIGMLLAQDPKLLLVDEPAAGMTDAETMRTAELLRTLAGKHSILVIEHDMEFVRALDCKVTVLHRGHVLAEGSLDHVSANPEVIEVYLGR